MGDRLGDAVTPHVCHSEDSQPLTDLIIKGIVIIENTGRDGRPHVSNYPIRRSLVILNIETIFVVNSFSSGGGRPARTCAVSLPNWLYFGNYSPLPTTNNKHFLLYTVFLPCSLIWDKVLSPPEPVKFRFVCIVYIILNYVWYFLSACSLHNLKKKFRLSLCFCFLKRICKFGNVRDIRYIRKRKRKKLMRNYFHKLFN